MKVRGIFFQAVLLCGVMLYLMSNCGKVSGQVVTVKLLHSFLSTNGLEPQGSLCLGPDGNFYGTTSRGGTNGSINSGGGTIFRMTTNGTLTSLASFGGADGFFPTAGLMLGTDGNFYGTTQNGGTNGNFGTVFKVTSNGVLTSLVSFNGTNGTAPNGLILGTDGNFYGTTEDGGTNGNTGTVFQVTTNGVLASLVSFNTNLGTRPVGVLILGTDGLFYGVAAKGGSSDDGSIFKVTTNGILTSVLILGPTIGSFPVGLTLGSDGFLYVTTLGGDTNSAGNIVNGTIFKFRFPDGRVGTIKSFNIKNGKNPTAALTLGSDGNFYGTTFRGGTNGTTSFGDGTAFRYTTNGSLNTLVSFGCDQGVNPAGGLTLGSDGNLYGTTVNGGSNGGFGTVFKVTTGGAFTTLASFNNTNGAGPETTLTQGGDGNFYGTTPNGGTNGVTNGGFGTVFKMTTDGVLSALVSFNGTNGSFPYAGLTLGLDGSFYGTTQNGGTNGTNGTVFKITTNGLFTSLVSFNGANGATPMDGLTLGNDGNFYGTSSAGGSNDVSSGGDGTVFRVTTNGILTTLASFSAATGKSPFGDLFLGSDGFFYGVAIFGGNGGGGTIFKVTTNGLLTVLASFNGTNGSIPIGPLTLGADGNFYGTTLNGGAYLNVGTVFRLTVGGVLTSLLSFNDVNGEYPLAPLTLGSDGNFYGTTSDGGPSDLGTVFMLVFHPDIYHVTVVGNAVTLSVASTSGSTNRIWASPDPTLPLIQWQVVATNVADVQGRFQFTDSDTASYPTKFYRASTP